MNLTLKYGNETKEYIEKVSRPAGTYAQVLNHVEYTKKMGMKVQNILDFPPAVEARVQSIPSVRQRIVTGADAQAVTMTEPLQRWLFKLFRENAPSNMTDADVLKCYASSLTGHTAVANRTGWDTVDEVTGEYVYQDWNLGTGNSGKGWKLQPVIFHGATIKILGDPFYQGNQWRVAFEVLDAFDSDTLTRTYKDNRHVINAAMSWNRMRLNVTPEHPQGDFNPAYPYGRGNCFPKLGGMDVPIPMLGNKTTIGFIELDWIRYLTPDEPFPSPYWGN